MELPVNRLAFFAGVGLHFSLGTTGILPASYQLTLDPSGPPVPPASGNIVLQGP